MSDSLLFLQVQCRRVYEILRLCVTDLGNAEEYRAYRLEVKNRLNIPFQVFNFLTIQKNYFNQATLTISHYRPW